MVVTPDSPTLVRSFNIRWELLPDDFKLDHQPVENPGQPLIAGALRASLELAGYI